MNQNSQTEMLFDEIRVNSWFDSRCSESQCGPECIGEGWAVGGSPWPVAGDRPLVADTKFCEQQCGHEYM